MKWRVDIEYEDGSFTEPRRIAFQAVYDGEPYHGYETKKEALEAFCVGQVAMREMLKEREAEQKKEEEKIKEAKEVAKAYESFPRLKICGEQKPEERIDVVRDFSPKEEGRKPVFYSKIFPPTIEERIDLLERYLGISKAKMKQTVSTLFVEQDNRLEKIENRLTEIEGVLSSIGSPDYDLRKKVEGLEKGLAQLTDTFYICANNETHNYEDLRKRVEAIEHQTDKKDIEEINEVLEMVDKGKADTFYEQVNKIGKNDYKECKANPFRCEKCGIEFKIVSQERALVEHCPSCGNKPKRIEE